MLFPFLLVCHLQIAGEYRSCFSALQSWLFFVWQKLFGKLGEFGKLGGRLALLSEKHLFLAKEKRPKIFGPLLAMIKK